MRIANSKIYKDRIKELPLTVLSKSLSLNQEERTDLKRNVSNLTIIGAIDKEIAKPANGVELIYLIELKLKDDGIPNKFMTAFDRQTQAHTVFEIPWNGHSIYLMARKTIKNGKVNMGSFYETAPEPEMLIEINTSETLSDIYSNLYGYVVGLKRRVGETADDIENRSKRIMAIEKEIETLQRQTNNEKQPNKRIDLNEELKRLRTERESLL